MGLEDRVRNLRQQALAQGHSPTPHQLQGVSKDRIRQVLGRLALGTPEMVDAVFALLDDQSPSWFPRAAQVGRSFCEGASTAHVGCHVGILQRGGSKLDREGRDYWIKPLRSLGAIEAVYLRAAEGDFIPGHPVPKSSNSAYRLNPAFQAILQAPEGAWEVGLAAWVAEEALRERLALQAEAEARARALVDTGHADLIRACEQVYAPRFLPGFEVLYRDVGDGDRITQADRARLARAGVDLRLGDAMPDLLLWHPEEDRLWVIEAVTSDGEVDEHKKARLSELSVQCGKTGIGFTTAYWTWKAAAGRQGRFKNIAVDTFVWIAEDPGKHWRAQTFPPEPA